MPRDDFKEEGMNVPRAQAGLALWSKHHILQSKHQLMTASMVHVTNRVTPGSDNPSRAYGNKHQLTTPSMVHVTAVMVHVTNLTPGSECAPTLRAPRRWGSWARPEGRRAARRRRRWRGRCRITPVGAPYNKLRMQSSAAFCPRAFESPLVHFFVRPKLVKAPGFFNP